MDGLESDVDLRLDHRLVYIGALHMSLPVAMGGVHQNGKALAFRRSVERFAILPVHRVYDRGNNASFYINMAKNSVPIFLGPLDVTRVEYVRTKHSHSKYDRRERCGTGTLSKPGLVRDIIPD